VAMAGTVTLGEAAALVGVVLGALGSVLGVLNYLRDRSRVTVTLQWDMSVTPGPVYDASKKWGFVKVANVGRRPVFVSHAALYLPKGSTDRILLLRDSVTGEKLAEGDPPKSYMVDQSELGSYTGDWKKVYVEIIDSTGKKWRSKRQKWQTVPSWVSEK
jgi:hypothetical protein